MERGEKIWKKINAQDEITAQGQVSSADSVYITGHFGLDFLVKITFALYVIKEHRTGFLKRNKRTVRLLDSLEYFLS